MFKSNSSHAIRWRHWLHAACLVMLMVSGFRAAASCFPPPAGIIGFWEGDGNAIDVVGGNNGTLVSNANATATGLVNSAFGFDGVRSYVQIPDSPALHPTNFTIEAWINFTSLTSTTSGGAGTGEQYIVFKQNSRSSEFEGFELGKQVDASSHHVFHFVVIGSAGVPAQINSTTIIATNTWYHVAAVRGSNYLQLYVNGSLQAQTNVTFAQDYGTLPLYFGTTGQAYDGKFSGRLDEVSLYNVALDSGTIASIYNAGSSGKCRPPANDAFANATVITGVSNTVSGTNINATREYGETGLPTFQPSGGASVWWSFTPPDNGTLTVNLNTNFVFPVELAAYSGSTPSNLVLLASNIRNLGNQFLEQSLSNLTCDVQKNVPCHILVDTADGSSDAGIFSLTFLYTEAPTNDEFAFRIPIASTSTTTTGSNIAASFETNEPAHSGNQPGRSVWWTWTPGSNQPVVLSTYGSTFDTVLDVYTNSTLASLSLVAGNDNCYSLGGTNGPTNDPTSRVSFNALAGVPYQIAVSGATNDSGNVSLSFVNVSIQSIVSVTRTVQGDNSVTFSATLQVTNMRPSVTGPLRIRLIARPGYAYTQYLTDNNPGFISTLNAPDVGFATFAFPNPGTLAGNSSAPIQVSGTVDPPYLSGDSSWGFGRVVVAVLEENVGGTWTQRDGRLIVAGVWPPVGGFNGPGGGVVTVNAGFGTPGGNPGSIVVSIGPPLALRMGGAWRVSPTNYGSMGELRFFTNFTSNSYSLVVQSTNFTIEVNPVTFLASPSNQNMFITAGSVVPLNLLYTIPSPRLKYGIANGLAISALETNTGYIIQSATSSQMVSGNWQTVTNITLLTTNSTAINNTKPTAISNQFYRAVWSSQ